MNVIQSTVLRIWSTVLEFDPESYMEVKPAQHYNLINPSDSDQVAELRMGRISLKLDDPLGIVNLRQTFKKKKIMINAVHELSPRRKVLAIEKIKTSPMYNRKTGERNKNFIHNILKFTMSIF